MSIESQQLTNKCIHSWKIPGVFVVVRILCLLPFVKALHINEISCVIIPFCIEITYIPKLPTKTVLHLFWRLVIKLF